MQYQDLLEGPDPLLSKLEEHSQGSITFDQFLAWADSAGISRADLRAKLAAMSTMPGAQHVSEMAKQALPQLGSGPAAIKTGIGAVAKELGAGGSERDGAMARGAGSLGWLGAAVVVGVAAVGGYNFYHRNDDAPAVRVAGALATETSSAPAAEPAPDTYDRTGPESGVMADSGRASGLNLDLDQRRFEYQDPDTHARNVIRWDVPPSTITEGQMVNLRSWVVDVPPNPGAEIEVHWETAIVRVYGASSRYNETEKISEVRAPWSRIDLVGGPIDAPFSFRIRWTYERAQH